MRLPLIFLLQLITVGLLAQMDTIRIKNGSFEDRPRSGRLSGPVIKAWYDCGAVEFPGESAPDIHPVNFWHVNLPAAEGNTYLGMVVRDNESWEFVSQRLSMPITKGKCYKFSVKLARSNKYLSGSRKLMGNIEVQYTRPSVLKIWGSNGYCGRAQLLAESAAVENYNWEVYDFEFKAKSSHLFITLEAFYKTPVLIPYNGHVLIDGLTDIFEMSCDGEEEIIAEVKEPEPKPKKKPDAAKPKPVEKEEPVVAVASIAKPKPKPEKPRTKKINGLLKKDLSKGQTLRIKNLLFRADKSTMNRSSFQALNEVYDFLEENDEIKIEIGGHTNGVRGITHEFCDKLSLARAKTVADFLIEKGLDPDRLTFKGYGKRHPIASNETKTGRNKNQRVEIKILSLG